MPPLVHDHLIEGEEVRKPDTEVKGKLPEENNVDSSPGRVGDGDWKKDLSIEAGGQGASLQPETSNDSGQDGPEDATPSDTKDSLDEKGGKHASGGGENVADRNSDSHGSSKHKTEKERAAKILDKLIDGESEASGDDEDIWNEVKHTPYQSMRSPLAERLPKAEKRMYQNILYISLVEDRLKHLEQSLKELQGRDKESPKIEKAKKFSHVPAIKYLKWADFESKPLQREQGSTTPWVHGDPGTTANHSVLEVLIEEPQINIRRRHRGHKRETSSVTELNGSQSSPEALKANQSTVNGPQLPIQLRIRSPLLVKILANFSPGKVLGAFDCSTLLILRPFKLLAKNIEQIKDHLKDLEEKHRETTISADKPTTDADVRNELKFEENESMAAQQSPVHLSTSQSTDEESKEEKPTNDIESYEALEHLRILVKFMDDDLKHIWDLRQKYKEGTLRKIAFADLWHLFDYDQEVRTPEIKGMQLFRVLAFTGGRELINWMDDPHEDTAAKRMNDYSQGAFFIQCYHVDFNGTHYGPKDKFFMIRKFEGEKDINTLPCFPLACDPQEKQLRAYLLDRGDKFTKLSSPNNAAHRHKTYTGLTLDKQQEQVDSQVIIDFQSAFLRNSDWKPELGFDNTLRHDTRETYMRPTDLGTCGREGCCGNDFINADYDIDNATYSDFQRENKDFWDQVDSAEELDDDEKILLPHRAFGFVLRSRKWATFDIELLNEVTYNDGWSNLELPSGHKETVLALVESHAGGPNSGEKRSETFATMDLVRGKGKGLIILLHGEPGVGKTSTAECVADHTKRPLFPITCGDIGDNAEKVEENLENNFQFAHRWGCVLLLDEADVFLAKRDKADLARNAIVSVFLRTLEYYSGILFLTTNRVGTIDEAFRSRIHLSLLYPRLDRSITIKIWKNHLSRLQKQLKDEKKKFEIDKKDIIAFARSHYKELENLNMAPWNGRQIRNAFQTAMALAEYDSRSSTPKLNRIQFKSVAETSKQFDFYLKAVWGGRDEAEMARQEQRRVDAISAEQLKVGTTMPRQMPSLMTTLAAATSVGKGKMPAAKTTAAQPQQQLPGEASSEHSSDDDDLETDEEEEAETRGA